MSATLTSLSRIAKQKKKKKSPSPKFAKTPQTPQSEEMRNLSTLVKDGQNNIHSFINISDDNRLKIWDVVSGSLRQSYTEEQHLSTKYTCIAHGPKTEVSSDAPLAFREGNCVLTCGKEKLRVCSFLTQTHPHKTPGEEEEVQRRCPWCVFFFVRFLWVGPTKYCTYSG
jgi:hypothetical protein